MEPDATTAESAAQAQAPGARPAEGELIITSNPLLRGLYRFLGMLCVALGVLGVVLPGWPTTVWLIVATFFFARSSPRFYRRLMEHRLFGPLIRDYRAGRGIPARAKYLAITMIVLFAGSSALLLVPSLPLRLLVAGAGAVGVFYLWRLPTRRD